eukprot:353793-Chlamydomonas_euryale.AAC.1
MPYTCRAFVSCGAFVLASNSSLPACVHDMFHILGLGSRVAESMSCMADFGFFLRWPPCLRVRAQSQEVDDVLDAMFGHFCRRCRIFNCRLHGKIHVRPNEKPRPPPPPPDGTPPCGPECWRRDTKLRAMMEDAEVGVWGEGGGRGAHTAIQICVQCTLAYDGSSIHCGCFYGCGRVSFAHVASIPNILAPAPAKNIAVRPILNLRPQPLASTPTKP